MLETKAARVSFQSPLENFFKVIAAELSFIRFVT